MKRTEKILLLSAKIALVSILVLNVSCKKDDNGGGSIIPIGDEITGIVYAPDGTTPIAGATVFVPESLTLSAKKARVVLKADDCPVPSEDYLTYTCTEVDGSFTLDVSSVIANTFTMRITKGTFVNDVIINKSTTNANLGKLEFSADPAQGGGNFAVITGSWDRMEDILAKLGMGEIGGDMLNPYLIPGTETFDLYDGNNSLGNGYPEFPEIFDIDPITSKAAIYNYDMVFINCGNDYEYEILEGTENKISVLRDYVNTGGRIYATDLSYDFVEQVFPEYINFYGSDEIAETNPEYMDDAEVGESDITSDATIEDATLALWLSTISCEGGSCLVNPTTVHIAGFLSGWAVINGAHPSKAEYVKIWIRGPVEWSNWETGTETGIKPLTVSFVHGEGKVIYSSYHTEEENPTSGFWPQERILQYLVFE